MSEFEKKMEQTKENSGAESKKSYGEIQREKTAELTKKAKAYAKEAVKTVPSFKNLLNTVSAFTRLSENNIMLIASQHTGATKLESFGNWQKQEGFIKKGAKGIHIIGSKDFIGKDGEKHHVFFDDCRFDISDVDKVKVPEKRTYDQKELMKALVHSAAAKIKVDPDYPDDKSDGAYYDPQKNEIHCQYGMTFGDMFTSVAKAIAHSEISEADAHYRNSDGEFYARSVAYTLAKKYDVSTNLCEISSIPAEFQSMDCEQAHDEVCRIINYTKKIDGRMSEVLDRPKQKNKEHSEEKEISKEKEESDKDKEDAR